MFVKLVVQTTTGCNCLTTIQGQNKEGYARGKYLYMSVIDGILIIRPKKKSDRIHTTLSTEEKKKRTTNAHHYMPNTRVAYLNSSSPV